MDKNALLSQSALTLSPYEVWDTTVYLKEMSTWDRFQLLRFNKPNDAETVKESVRFMLSHFVCNDKGQPLFTSNEADKLIQMRPYAEIESLVSAIKDHAGLSATVDDAKKN